MTTTRRFGAYPANDLNRGIPTATASYESGKATGRRWTESYVPGGPWVCNPDISWGRDDNDWIAYCAATRENHSEWMRGFHDGRKTVA